ncbi:hypothetical protein PIB30_087493 [Stylosanthes scabra]|uniref:Uncharacterized protein n=1 Tax=Stylosanthes scabra TaxID=79078 RepID=A0ABU6VT89_9FABA|nr:hypothetical protein [Stylosanthes scabra]
MRGLSRLCVGLVKFLAAKVFYHAYAWTGWAWLPRLSVTELLRRELELILHIAWGQATFQVWCRAAMIHPIQWPHHRLPFQFLMLIASARHTMSNFFIPMQGEERLFRKLVSIEDDEYPEIMEQIALRGWRRLADPRTDISKLLVQEFYANAAVSDEEAAVQEELPYKSFVRGKEI